MPLDLAKVHETEKIEGTTEFRLVKVHPTCGLSRQGEAPIWIQDGGIYFESGEPVTNPPEWFWEDCRKMTLERRRQLGIRLPEEPEPARRTEAPMPSQPARPLGHKVQRRKYRTRPAGDKTCPQCGKTGLKHLGAHMQHHKKKE